MIYLVGLQFVSCFIWNELVYFQINCPFQLNVVFCWKTKPMLKIQSRLFQQIAHAIFNPIWLNKCTQLNAVATMWNDCIGFLKNKSFQQVFQSMLSKILTILTYFKRAFKHTPIQDCRKIVHCGYALQYFCGAKWFSSGFCRHRQRHWKANKTGCDRFSCNHINKHSHAYTLERAGTHRCAMFDFTS